jgi:hypothetical protein
MALTNIDISRIAQEALANAQEKVFPVGAIATNFGGVAKEGDVIKVDVLAESDGAAAYNSSTNNYTKDRSLTEAFKDVTVSSKFLDGFSLTPTEFKALSEDGLRKRINRHVRELTRTMLVDTMGLLTEANYSLQEVIGADTAFDKTKVTQIRTNAGFKKFGLEDTAKAVVGVDYFENLMEDQELVDSRGATDANRNSSFSAPYRGLDWMASNIIPTNSESLVGFVTDGTGVALGVGVSDDLADQNPFGLSVGSYDSEIFTTPEGLAMRMTINYDQGTKTVNVVFDCVWGKAVGQASKLLLLASAV